MENIESDKFKTLTLPCHEDDRGKLCVTEMKDYVDWKPERIYYVTDVKLPRGGHAVKTEKKMYVVLKGSCKAKIHDGEKWHEFKMEGPSDAIVMNGMCWREFEDFTEDCVLLAISSINYNRDLYIMDFDEFLKEVQ